MATVDQLLTAEAMAAVVKTRSETITAWARKGIIPCIRINRRVIRYRAADVLAALDKQAEQKGVLA